LPSSTTTENEDSYYLPLSYNCSTKSRFSPRLEAAANGKGNWWEIVQEPGIRIGRGNPATDPGARSILLAMMLASIKYNQPDLVTKVLGQTLNPEQIIPGVLAGVQSGALDLSSSYKIAASAGSLPYILLPEDVNLSRLNVHAEHPDMKLSIGGQTFYPEPLVFYAALLKGGANPTGAAAFLDWLRGAAAQALFHQHHFDPPGDAPTIHV
jgi:molybdate/tungstate transport system substrate-binding protein